MEEVKENAQLKKLRDQSENRITYEHFYVLIFPYMVIPMNHAT